MPAPSSGSREWPTSYYAFITDREGPTLELEADYSQHAVIENVIRGKFGANAAGWALNVIAHNLCHWMGRLGGFAITCLKAWRRRSFSLLASLVEHGRRRRLRPPAHWPWKQQLAALMATFRALPALLTS